MGKTSNSGPSFGAKQLLWQWSGDVGSGSSGNLTVAGIVVPSGEDWYVTDLHVHRRSTNSTAAVVNLLDDSTTVASLSLTSSLANLSASTRPTPDQGEYAGTRIITGSSLTIQFQTGGSSAGTTGVSVWVYGFPRWDQNDTRGF